MIKCAMILLATYSHIYIFRNEESWANGVNLNAVSLDVLHCKRKNINELIFPDIHIRDLNDAFN